MSDDPSGSRAAADDAGTAEPRLTGVVLDTLPHGRPEDDRPGFETEPLALVLGDDFRCYECVLDDAAGVSIDDRIALDPPAEVVGRVREIPYDDLTGGAQSELEYVVEELVEDDPDRFVGFYNEAEPITLRLHQLNLLPGIGKKLRNAILDERERDAFDDFEGIADRVTGLHDPKGTLVDRILEEIREEDLKYRLFVGRDDE